mgnify:CR=1 FL=1|jgi:hypothetical protein|tara:strand:- start:9778 stop:10134 length:357 start_codon:yes stop_codon:yes gene_type:complete
MNDEIRDKTLDNVITLLAQKFEIPREEILKKVHEKSQVLLKEVENFVLAPSVLAKTIVMKNENPLDSEETFMLYSDLIASNLTVQVLATQSAILNEVINASLVQLCKREDLFQDGPSK